MHSTYNSGLLIMFKIPYIVTWLQLFLTSEVMEAVRGYKHSSEDQQSMNECIFLKKGFNKNCSSTSNTS